MTPQPCIQILRRQQWNLHLYILTIVSYCQHIANISVSMATSSVVYCPIGVIDRQLMPYMLYLVKCSPFYIHHCHRYNYVGNDVTLAMTWCKALYYFFYHFHCIIETLFDKTQILTCHMHHYRTEALPQQVRVEEQLWGVCF